MPMLGLRASTVIATNELSIMQATVKGEFRRVKCLAKSPQNACKPDYNSSGEQKQ